VKQGPLKAVKRRYYFLRLFLFLARLEIEDFFEFRERKNIATLQECNKLHTTGTTLRIQIRAQSSSFLMMYSCMSLDMLVRISTVLLPVFLIGSSKFFIPKLSQEKRQQA
jgi:hypothetical protein